MYMKKANGITALLAVIALAAMVALPSCKKKDKEETYKYLSGSMKYDLPVYVQPGETYVVRPSGVTHPEGKNLGYYVYTSWNSKRDTIRYDHSTDTSPISYTLTIPDELGDGYSFVMYAYAEDYFPSSKTTSLAIVCDDLEKVFSGLDFSDSDSRVTDPRDGMEYRTVDIDGKEWFRQNLSFDGCGVPFSNCPAMTKVTGKFYTWEEARTACPEGWHLSTGEDWLAVGRLLSGDDGLSEHDMFPGVAGDLMVDAKFFNSRMWEYWPNDVKVTNKLKFNAMSFGYATSSNDGSPKFMDPNEYAVFWTADADEEDGAKAWIRYLHYKQADVLSATVDKETFLASVRCVRD